MATIGKVKRMCLRQKQSVREIVRLTSLSHNTVCAAMTAGLSRAIDPLTLNDGGALVALATGASGVAADLTALGAFAAEGAARAGRNAVRAATA